MRPAKEVHIYASPEEAMRAFAALSAGEQLNLKQLARLRCLGLGSLSWEDLMQEALFRTFAGKRLWPKSVPFVAFLAQTLRSIASEERKRAATEQVSFESELGGPDDAMLLADLAVETKTPESEVAARSAIAEVERLFQADPEAKQILNGLAMGLTPSETQNSNGMTTTQYASAQKRIQRALARKYGKDS